MATIYLVWSAGGEYDDAWKHVVCARSTMLAAQSVIDDEKVEDEYLRELDKNLRVHMAGWLPKIAEIPYPQQMPKTKWPAGMRKADITQEMRDERARVEAENQARMVPYQENQTERFMERKNEEVRYLTEVAGLSQEDAEEKATNSYFGKWHPPGDDVHYYITETELE